jgi:multidrug efflux system membrane fusion protein
MHDPIIRSSRAGRAARAFRRLSRAAIGLALSPALLWGCAQAAATDAPAPPPPSVGVAEVLARELPVVSELTGRLESSRSVEIRPRVSGYIDSVNFAEGARVERGQLLFRIDARPFEAEVERLAAEVARSSAALRLAHLNHERGARLFEQRVIPEQESDQLRSEEEVARAGLAAATAALGRARLDLEFARVRSPIAGRASRALIQAGNLVSSADLLTTVVAEDPAYAYFDADEQSFLALSQEGPARSRRAPRTSNPVLLALIDEDGYPHEGRLDFIDNRVDPRAGTIRGRAVFANPDGRLTPGLFARLALVTEPSRRMLLVSERAVGTDLGKKFVLVLRADQTLEYRPVTLGASVEDLRVVDAGLGSGEVVVVSGLSHVRAGSKVNPRTVAMTAKLDGLERLASLSRETRPSAAVVASQVEAP